MIGVIISKAISEVAKEYKSELGIYLGKKHPGHSCLMENILKKIKETIDVPLFKCKHVIRRRRIICKRCYTYLNGIINPHDTHRIVGICYCNSCQTNRICKIESCTSMEIHNFLFQAYPCSLCCGNNKAKTLRRFTRDSFYCFILCLKATGLYKLFKDLLPLIFKKIQFKIVKQSIMANHPLYNKELHKWNPADIFHEVYLEDENQYQYFNITCHNTIYLYHKTCFLKSSPDCLGRVKYSGDDLKPMACINCSKHQLLTVSPNYRPEDVEEKDLITKCTSCNKFLKFVEWYICSTCNTLIYCSEKCSKDCLFLSKRFNLSNSCYERAKIKKYIKDTLVSTV